MQNPASLAVPARLNQSCFSDFMHDALLCGRRLRKFCLVNDFRRGVIAIEIDLNIPAQRGVRMLDGMTCSL